MGYKFKKFKKQCWDYRIADKEIKEACEEFGIGAKNQSKSSCYHLAGDSIVTTVLMAILDKCLTWIGKQK